MAIISYISQVNWIPVIISTILSFVLGALWHQPFLFGKAWAMEISSTHEKSKSHYGMVFGLSAILHFIAAASLSALIGRQSNAIDGLLTGLIVSIVFVSTTIGVTYIFAARSFKLFLIDAGFYIVFFSIAGLIIGLW